MSMDNGRQEQVSVADPERSEGTATEAPRPDPEVSEKAKRRRFTARYKLRVLNVGDTAPLFALPSHQQRHVSLASHRGKRTRCSDVFSGDLVKEKPSSVGDCARISGRLRRT